MRISDWSSDVCSSDLPIAFFENVVQIAVLVIAWIIVIAAFFILSVQLFVTILEFKLTSLAGFILVPFALWNRTAFLAERVLGSVITSEIGRASGRERGYQDG